MTQTNTTFLMSEATQERLALQLVAELEDHPHKDEIISLATAQLLDDDT